MAIALRGLFPPNSPLYVGATRHPCFPCPLCLNNTDEFDPPTYRLVSLDPATASATVNATAMCERRTPSWQYYLLMPTSAGAQVRLRQRTAGGRWASTSLNDDDDDASSWRAFAPIRPSVRADTRRRASWMIHRRCYEMVQPLSHEALLRLINIVEPTDGEAGPKLQAPKHGFWRNYRIVNRRAEPVEEDVSGASALGPEELERLGQRIEALPTEIHDQIMRQDIGRLLFVLRAEQQIRQLPAVVGAPITVDRFHAESVKISGDWVRLRFIEVGQRGYLAGVSDPEAEKNGQTDSKTGEAAAEVKAESGGYVDHQMQGNNYLAVKSDGVGVVDIAFETRRGEPAWILNAKTRPFPARVEVTECQMGGNRVLKVSRDLLKLRSVRVEKVDAGYAMGPLGGYEERGDQ